MAEHPAVNRRVAGSSPARGAIPTTTWRDRTSEQFSAAEHPVRAGGYSLFQVPAYQSDAPTGRCRRAARSVFAGSVICSQNRPITIPAARCDVDAQVLLEIGHRLLDRLECDTTRDARPPHTRRDCPEHQVVRRRTRCGSAGRREQWCDFLFVGDQDLAPDAEAARLSEHHQMRPRDRIRCRRG